MLPKRFSRRYLHDGILQRIELDNLDKRCFLHLDRVLRLKPGSLDHFDPEEQIEPALFTLEGVRSLGLEVGDYFLNATVVESSVAASQHEGLFDFRFTCTGG